MATLQGKITDVTHKPPESLSSITVKAPSARVGGGTDLIVSSPATVDFDRGTGDVTISGLTGGLSWLYIEGDGWSDSIALAVAEGMITLVEAIANAAGIPGMADFMRLLQDIEATADGLVHDAVATEAAVLNSRISQLTSVGQATSIAYGAAAAVGGGGGVSVGQATSIAYGAAAAMAGEPAPPVVVEGLPVWDASYPVYLWGDSAIDRGSAGDRLADYLDSTIHQTVVDNAHGGTPIGDVLFRTGAAPLYGIPVGGSIPADTTPVEVDRMGADISMIHGGEIPVTWAGVPGKITYYAGRYHESGYHTVEFTRTNAGDAVAISTPTRLEPVDVFDPYATNIIVSGGNDWSKGYITTAPEGDKAGHLIGSYIKLVEQAAAAPVKHILIGGVKTRADTMPGDNIHQFVTKVNNQLKQLFPHLFVDRQRWLCERGPEILGLTLTADEQTQQDAGIIPARVFTDETHVGSEIRQAEAKELWAHALAQRGWAQLTTPVTGYSMPIMDNTITPTDLV